MKKTKLDYQDLIRKGYCIVSRKYGCARRIDREDWLDVLKEKHKNWFGKKGGLVISAIDAEDFYRRMYSRDEVEDVSLTRHLPNSGRTKTGFIKLLNE